MSKMHAADVVALALLCLMAAVALADWPPAPGSGGQKCTFNAECGIPAANCQSLREKCVSLTGACTKGKCVCAANMYGCKNCAAKAVLTRNETDPSQFYYTTKMPKLDGSGGTVDLCSVPNGGAGCVADADCGGHGGLCIDEVCVCAEGWTCGNCTIQFSDLQYGLTCATADGGGPCNSSKECNNGQCQGGFCQCNPLYACRYCTQKTTDLAKGNATCP